MEPNGNDTSRDKIFNNIFLDVVETQGGVLWFASRKGLIKKDAHTNQLTRHQHDPYDSNSISHDNVLTVFLDSQDRLWAGTGFGISLYDTVIHSFVNYVPESYPSDNSVEPFFKVFSILENTDGKLWVGSDQGLYVFDPRTKKFQLKLDESVQSLMVDQQGILWVGTISGLFQIEPNRPKFRIYHRFGQKNISMVRVLGEDVNKHLWVTGPGLFRFDPSTEKLYEYVHDAMDPSSYSGYPIRDAIPGNDNTVWLASNYGLEKFDLVSQTFSRNPLPVRPYVMLQTSQGNLFLGAGTQAGLYHVQTGEFERIKSFPITTVRSLLEDKNGNIWAGTDAGLIKYNLKTADLYTYKSNSHDPKCLSNDIVYDLLMDQEGSLWLATARGLNKMITPANEENPQFVHWTTANSQLPNNVVWSVIDGGDGTLWLSCGNQISRFTPGSNVFKNYNSRDGLNGATVSNGLKSQTGEHFYSSKDGLIRFFPDNITDNSYKPPVVITKFSIHNQPVPVEGTYGDTLAWETPLRGIISYTDEIELSYRLNDIVFEFAALNYLNPENNLYKFRLEPYEDNWIKTDANNRVARYTNISPGQYTFQVIGANNSGLWNETGIILSVIVAPPWWRTWWAYLLYAITTLSILLYWRSHENKRTRLIHQADYLSELDRLKSRFFSNISHEFRTPLTLILGPVNKLLGKNNYSNDKHILQGIQRNANHLLLLVNQLLKLSKLEAGKLKLQLVKGDIVAYTKVLTDAFYSLAEDNGIQFIVDLPEEKIEAFFDQDKLAEIMNNLLSNAIKFTPKDGSVSVRMKRISYGTKGGIQIQIKDSGEGIPKEQLTRIFDRFHQADTSHKREGNGIGLALTKELVELHHGTIKVESTPGKGSLFTVVLPLGKDHLKVEELIREYSAQKRKPRFPGG